MELNTIVSSICTFIVLVCGWWIKDLIKSMPQLLKDTVLENHKANLQKENEKISIEYSEIQQYKVEILVKFLEYFEKFFTDEKFRNKTQIKNSNESKEFNRTFMSYGNKLMLFASDETIKKYVAFREFGKVTEQDRQFSNYLKIYGQFVISLRKDVGYSDTKITEVEYLSLWLTDTKENINKLINKR